MLIRGATTVLLVPRASGFYADGHDSDLPARITRRVLRAVTVLSRTVLSHHVRRSVMVVRVRRPGRVSVARGTARLRPRLSDC